MGLSSHRPAARAGGRRGGSGPRAPAQCVGRPGDERRREGRGLTQVLSQYRIFYLRYDNLKNIAILYQFWIPQGTLPLFMFGK